MENKSDYIKYCTYTILYKSPLIKYFISKGHDMENPSTTWNGGQVLIKLKNGKYILIGNDIVEYNFKDDITHFYAPVGPSRTPRPIAVSNTKIYSLSGEEVSISDNTLHNLNDKEFIIKCVKEWNTIMYRKDSVKIGKILVKLT